jgi:hypothetical protein
MNIGCINAIIILYVTRKAQKIVWIVVVKIKVVVRWYRTIGLLLRN